MTDINSYKLSREWFDWCFENPEKIKPIHTAIYFYIIEHCNRLGWKEKFGLPTSMVKETIGISSYNTYINTLNDLVEFGFIKIIERSKNQYSSNILALSFFDKALDKAGNKALDKALSLQVTKQVTKQSESIDSINKLLNKETIKLINDNASLLNSKLAFWIKSDKGFNLEFVSDDFVEVVERWLDYKKGRKEKYKTEDSLKSMYNKLLKLSNSNPETAQLIIEEAISNNYAGFFALKNKLSIPEYTKKPMYWHFKFRNNLGTYYYPDPVPEEQGEAFKQQQFARVDKPQLIEEYLKPQSWRN